MTSEKKATKDNPRARTEKKESFKSGTANKFVGSIMVVDDSSAMRKLLHNHLQKIGIKNIIEAENGLQGIKKLKKNKVDIIIADWLMPIMNGAVMVKEIRKNPDYDNIPIILVSAEYGEKIDKAIKAGANGYLNKPFNFDDLKTLLAKFASNI